MIAEMLAAVRRLAARRSYSIAAIATLAVGIGATTAIFSAVNATLLRPLPYPGADEIYEVRTRFVDGRYTSGRLAGAQLVELNETARSVDLAVTYIPGELSFVREDGTAFRVPMANVGEGFFEMFGLPLAAGRLFVSEEHRPGSPADRVAIISHRLWQSAFGGDPGVLGQYLAISGTRVPIIGVAAPEFDVPSGTDVFLPTTVGDNIAHSYHGYVRVVPGTTRERFESELPAVMSRVVERHPIATGRAFVTYSLTESIVGDLGPILVVVLAGTFVLLVLGCVNVATLILGRGATQTRELALYAALGATRQRILGRFLAEGAVLSIAGTVLGLLLAFAGVRILFAYAGAELPRLDSIPFDRRVLGFSLLTMVVATLLIGLLPAIRLSTPDIRGLLSEGGRSASASRGSRRVLRGLLVVEIGLAIMLVAGAGWLVRGYAALAGREMGFTPAGRLLVQARMPDDTAAARAFAAELPDRLASIDRVTAIGSGSGLLNPFPPAGLYVGVPGEEYDPDRQDVGIQAGVSLEYFDALGTRVIAGRMLTDADRPPTPNIIIDPQTGVMSVAPPTGPPPIRIVVVNQEFVDRYFGGQDAIGRRFATGFPQVNFDNLHEVVGVVEDVRHTALVHPVQPMYYVISGINPGNIFVATDMADATELIPTIRAALRDVSPSVTVEITPLSAMVREALAPYRLGLVLMVLFAVVSLALAAIGIFGVVAHATSERTRELAIRAALGTTPAGVVSLLLKEGHWVAVTGILAGAAAAVVGGRIVSSRIYEVPARDPVILVVAGTAVLAIAVLAYLFPAIRASRIAPAEALKAD